MSGVVLDTDVSSLVFKGRLPAALGAKLIGLQPALTFVTVGELSRWGIGRGWGERRRTALEAWVGRRPMIGADALVARKWGEITAYADRRGRPRPYNDSWIAARCLAVRFEGALRRMSEVSPVDPLRRATAYDRLKWGLGHVWAVSWDGGHERARFVRLVGRSAQQSDPGA